MAKNLRGACHWNISFFLINDNIQDYLTYIELLSKYNNWNGEYVENLEYYQFKFYIDSLNNDLKERAKNLKKSIKK